MAVVNGLRGSDGGDAFSCACSAGDGLPSGSEKDKTTWKGEGDVVFCRSWGENGGPLLGGDFFVHERGK